jgi:long-chain acyl-CoA synthetase
MKTLLSLFEKNAIRAPGRVAISHRGQETTYGELLKRADALAGWLGRQGIRTGDRVALLLENSAEYVSCYLGVQRAGGVVVALNPQTTADELVYHLEHCVPRTIIVGESSVGVLQEALSTVKERPRVLYSNEPKSLENAEGVAGTLLAQVWRAQDEPQVGVPSLDHLAQIIYTSGTTGRPKGVTLSHRNIAANCCSILSYLELTRSDSVLVTLPFFYSYGNSLLFTHLAAGGKLVLASDFVFWNRVLDLMETEQVSGFSGVPSSFAMLLHRSDFRKRSFRHLRYLTCAGGGLAPAVSARVREVVPHAKLFLMYGQTEATARLSTLLPEQCEVKPNSIGQGIAGVTLEVVDETGEPVAAGEVGEIVARGDNLMVGYWNDEEATCQVLRPEGLRTGDLAVRDEEGDLFIVGRKSDLIKSGSYRLNPQEIEQVILELEGVAEVAVVGLPDEIWGESPVAFIVPASGSENLQTDEVIRHCRGRLPRYKQIREARQVEALPKTPSGKIKRAEISEAARRGNIGSERVSDC